MTWTSADHRREEEEEKERDGGYVMNCTVGTTSYSGNKSVQVLIRIKVQVWGEIDVHSRTQSYDIKKSSQDIFPTSVHQISFSFSLISTTSWHKSQLMSRVLLFTVKCIVTGQQVLLDVTMETGHWGILSVEWIIFRFKAKLKHHSPTTKYQTGHE